MSPRSSERLCLSIAIILCAALLTGCGGQTMNTRITLPPLPGSVSASCSPLMKLGSDDPVLIWQANAYHMKALAGCELSRAGAVSAYEAARQLNP